MTTHASHSHDAIERLMELRDRLDERIKEEEARREKLIEATELALLMADCVQVLRQIPDRNLSESQRLRVNGVLGRLKAQLGKAA